jgi:hypothetical protein
MEKEFVPYQEALALKELGFNLECGYLYNSTDVRHKPYPCDTLGLGKDWNTLYTKDTNKHLLSAPLYQQAFRWFREKYDLHFTIDYVSAADILKYELWIKGRIHKYNTYEEAEFKCIKKLIEIAKL